METNAKIYVHIPKDNDMNMKMVILDNQQSQIKLQEFNMFDSGHNVSSTLNFKKPEMLEEYFNMIVENIKNQREFLDNIQN